METNKAQNEQLTQDAVKCRFFSQYYGLKVAFIPSYPDGNDLIKSKVSLIREIQYIELKPLSKITDEDAISMFRGVERNYTDAKQFLDDYKAIGFLEQSEADYLRSKGYALPFMEYSVEDLISFGWVRLV